MTGYNPVLEVIYDYPKRGGIQMKSIEEKRRIFELHNQGLCYSRIGAIMGFSPNTIKSIITRAKVDGCSVCMECGKILIFTQKKKQKKFCNYDCRMAWWSKHREKRNLKAMYDYVCPVCGKVFTAYGNPHRVYCSRECSAKGRKEAWNGKKR